MRNRKAMNSQSTAVSIAGTPKISEAWDAFEVFYQIWNKRRIHRVQEYKALLLDRGNHVISAVSLGSKLNDMKDLGSLIFFAKKEKAQKVIIAQNRPEQPLVPGSEEIKLAKQFKIYGDKLGMPIVDQILINSSGCYSFAENGLHPSVRSNRIYNNV